MIRKGATFLLLLVSYMQVDAQPASPERLVARAGDKSVILHWNANKEADLKGYRVFRAENEAGPFEQPIPAVFRYQHFVDFSVKNSQNYYYRVRAINTGDEESLDSEIIEARPDSLDDELFTELVQQTAFDFFWYEANPENGLIRDRSTAGSSSSIAAVGFGLSALTVGVDRGWLTRAEARERILNTLSFFWNSAQGPEADATGYRGFYYHFLNMQTGQRAGTSELSTIDTALLMAGVIHVGEYFDGDEADEVRIRQLSDSLYLRVEWDWAQPRPPRISHGWRPGSGYIPFDWGGYNEAMVVYLLALGSPTHGVDPTAWTSWTSSYKWETHYDFSFVVFPPLFGHQYTHVWYDFRQMPDAYMNARGIDYFENSRRATLANQAYAIDNPKNWGHYSEQIWGLTASDVPSGYLARGAPPVQNDEGTIAPTAAGGSFPFTPVESLAALREMYNRYRTQLWWWYGFKDAFNPSANWFASDHLGIDQGPIVLMIENHRSGAIWDAFMKNEYVREGLLQAGFARSLPTEDLALPEVDSVFDVFPNPAMHDASVAYELAYPAEMELSLFDMLGRKVYSVSSGFRIAGVYRETIDLDHLAAGVYVVVLQIDGPAGKSNLLQRKLVVGK